MKQTKTETTFQKRLKEAMKEKGLTNKELAQIVDCSEVTIKFWRTGKTFPYPENLEQLATALDVYPEWLSGDKDYKNATEEINSLLRENPVFKEIWKSNQAKYALIRNIETLLGYELYFNDYDNSFEEKMDSFVFSVIEYARQLDEKLAPGRKHEIKGVLHAKWKEINPHEGKEN